MLHAFARASGLCRFAVVLLAILTALSPRTASAQDKHKDYVVLRTPGKTGKTVLQCTIRDYTGNLIVLETVAGATRRYPTSHVVSVRTPQMPSHAKGLQHFVAGDYTKAVTNFEAALQIEERKWVRREILSMLVRSHRKSGDLSAAALHFLAITKSDAETRHMAEIPLVWTPRKVSPRLKGQAKLWLFEKNPAGKLIAAAVLIDDKMYGKTARETLLGLRVTTDTRINALAAAQLWRMKLRKGPPDAGELKQWKKTAAGLPGKLRAGPYYLIGRAHQARKEHEQAAAALLWIPLVYDEDRQLSARACLEAADALVDAGQPREALTLYREVQVRFAKTEFASEAAEQERTLTTRAGKK